MTASVFKPYIPKLKPTIVSYSSYKSFCNNSFKNELDTDLLNYDLYNIEYQHFLNVFLDIFNKHATNKKNVSEQIKVAL